MKEKSSGIEIAYPKKLNLKGKLNLKYFDKAEVQNRFDEETRKIT